MKRHVLALSSALLLPALLFAQIPNNGFETWVPSGLGYNDPSGWITWNVVTFPAGAGLSCEQAPGAVGTYSAKVTTRNVNGLGVVPGLLITGGQTAPGFPYTQQPAALNGSYMYSIPAGDGASITATFTKWNSSTQESESVGGGLLTVPPGTQSSWTTFSIPISWFAGAPDTATVTIFSSMGGGVDGSTISVDNLSFGAFSAIDEVASGPTLNLALSPDHGTLTIDVSAELAEIELVDMSGRVRIRQNATGLKAQADLRNVAGGLYIARARFTDGSQVSRVFVRN